MSENGFVELIKKNLLKIKAFLTSKNALNFLLCLVMSSVFWFTNALDKEQITEIQIPIRYVGVPQDVVITNKPPKTLKLSIRDKGKEVLEYAKGNLRPLTIDLDRMYYERGEFLITSDQLSGQISRYMSPTTIVTRVRPDSIVIEYEKLKSKKVPVYADVAYDLERQYMLNDQLSIEPSEITVYGSKRVLDTLKYVYTEHVTLKNIKDTTTIKTKLKPINSVRFAGDDVTITANVEMFTEKQFQLPITIINAPSDIQIKTFPAEINVKLNVGLTSFNKIVAGDVKVILDYNDIKENNSNSKVKLKVESIINNVSNITLNPDEVEFIIEK